MRVTFGSSSVATNTSWVKLISIGVFLLLLEALCCSHPSLSSTKRTPSWTDRVLYATYTDSPSTPNVSNVSNVLYTSIPSYTASDHVRHDSTLLAFILVLMYTQKPVVSLLLLPPRPADAPSSVPTLRLPAHYKPIPDPRATIKRYTGRVLDRIIGIIWWLFTLLGAGSSIIGLFNFFLGLGAWSWWKTGPTTQEAQV